MPRPSACPHQHDPNPWACGLRTQVSLNGQDYSVPASGDGSVGDAEGGGVAVDHFVYAVSPAVNVVEPTSGPALGSRPVAIRGANFSSGVAYTCGFGVALVGATRLDSHHVVCDAPPSHLTGAADALVLDLNESRVLSRGAELTPTFYELESPAAYVAPEIYIPPEELVVTSFRIVEQPATLTTGGTPFEGSLLIEL